MGLKSKFKQLKANIVEFAEADRRYQEEMRQERFDREQAYARRHRPTPSGPVIVAGPAVVASAPDDATPITPVSTRLPPSYEEGNFEQIDSVNKILFP